MSKFNENNKRNRPKTFVNNIRDDDDDENVLSPFKNKPKFENNIQPFSIQLSQLPGYKRIDGRFNPKELKNDKDWKMFRIWKKEKDKEEIRQIMMLNRLNKKKAVKDQMNVDYFVNQVKPSVFVTGRSSKRFKPGVYV